MTTLHVVAIDSITDFAALDRLGTSDFHGFSLNVYSCCYVMILLVDDTESVMGSFSDLYGI